MFELIVVVALLILLFVLAPAALPILFVAGLAIYAGPWLALAALLCAVVTVVGGLAALLCASWLARRAWAGARRGLLACLPRRARLEARIIQRRHRSNTRLIDRALAEANARPERGA